jgi:4-amino-4-deoxy-L-arabinose transferase-like glycosyltransferase
MLSRVLNNSKLMNLLAVVFTIALSLYYYATLIQVPFHPDEATYIYMSSDFKQFFTNPLSLQFKPGPQSDLKQHYRLVDPPLIRYGIGAGLAIAGIPPLPVDWDWALSWQENVDRGALPDDHLLTVSRLSVCFLFLLALISIYKAGSIILTPFTGLLALLFLGANALVLLHTRRAMAEAYLLPAICLCLWCFSSINRRPWLSGLAVMIAINAKLSASPLFFFGAICIFLLDRYQSISLSKRLLNLLVFTLIILLGTFLLNPVLWGDPFHVVQAAINERANLLSAQVSALQQIDSGQALTSLDKRIASLITHLFFSFPAALDIGNYREALMPMIDHYLSMPGTAIMRGILGGLVCFILTVFGLILMLTRLILKRDPILSFRTVFLLGFIILFGSMSATVSLPFQRYVIPLLPFTALLSAYGLSQILLPNKKAP